MVPFQLKPWQKRVNRDKFKRKDRLIRSSVDLMEHAMLSAVDLVLDHYYKTGQYFEPTLNLMYQVSESFYRNVITEAFHASEFEKKTQKKHDPVSNKETQKDGPSVKRLASWPYGIPKKLPGLEKIFRDRRYWPKVMKRSKRITDRVRTMYLRKLQARFKKILPDLDQGLITPKEARAKLVEAWEASKPRVELIFRTETTAYFNRTQVAFFDGDPEIIGFLFDSIRDTARTPWCKSRHGLIYRPGTKLLYENRPPCHWNCRSHLIPLADIPHNQEMLKDQTRNPEKRKVEPLPPGWRK